MSGDGPISLRGFLARRQYDKYVSLPAKLRTPERTRAVMGLIFDYAYEHVVERRDQPMPAVSVVDARMISRKLSEFIRPDTPGQESIMEWLRKNMVDEAWSSPDNFTDFVQAHLRDS
jgi:hypothetical protein